MGCPGHLYFGKCTDSEHACGTETFQGCNRRPPDPPYSRLGRDQPIRDLSRQVQVHTALNIVPDISIMSKDRQGTRRIYPRPQLSKDLEIKAQLQGSPGLPQDGLCQLLLMSYLQHTHIGAVHILHTSVVAIALTVIDWTHSALCMVLHLTLPQMYTEGARVHHSFQMKTLTTMLSKINGGARL